MYEQSGYDLAGDELAGDELAGDELAGDELAGAAEIMGAMEIGAASLGHRLPRPQLKAKRPDDGRRIPIGLGLRNVPANGRDTVTVHPQVLFRFERLLIPSDIAGSFMIEDVLVGNQSVFASSDAVPARVFDETATNVLLGVDTNQPATDLTVKVFNFTALPESFTGALIGIAVK